ncbi:MAG: L-glyceraldehyde 3-phosphate reductase [Pedobacter sp.]|nr:MAG: L-glyceraldehyde 3-phosphate reductase [Pedobacter sp.]
MTYQPSASRYQNMQYNRCGNSGLKLSAISLGLWHNFGDVDDPKTYRETLLYAFDNGITHFDLANNYGPPPGAAETNFGKILATDFKAYRDEMIISTKAGYTMWDGPYGDWGSKKYLVSSLDQSLKRMGIPYVDIFYHHRPDPETPLIETMTTLDLLVRQGKALYVGLSNYKPEEAKAAFKILNELGTPCIIHQPKYSMFERTPEQGLLKLLEEEKVGCIPFSPLAQGMLTNKYLTGIPENSRAARATGFLQAAALTPARLAQIQSLNAIAISRNQTLAQMALAWVLRQPAVTSVLVGASSKTQLADSIHTLDNLNFNEVELKQIEEILAKNL